MRKQYDNTNTGAVWKMIAKTESRMEYLSGKLDVEGKEWRITMFPNDRKQEGDNTPDFRIIIEEPKKQGGYNSGFSSGGSGATISDDIPF